jgi:hypothetical protein
MNAQIKNTGLAYDVIINDVRIASFPTKKMALNRLEELIIEFEL